MPYDIGNGNLLYRLTRAWPPPGPRWRHDHRSGRPTGSVLPASIPGLPHPGHALGLLHNVALPAMQLRAECARAALAAKGKAVESRIRPNGGFGETPGKLVTLK